LGVVMVSLGLLLSTRLESVSAGVLAAALFFVVWVAGAVGGVGQALHLGQFPLTAAANPFYAAAPAPLPFLLWSALWLAIVLTAAWLLVQRQDF
jgi:hypothetical protein